MLCFDLVWFTGNSYFECIGCLCISCLKLEFSVGLCLFFLNWHLRASRPSSSEGVNRPYHPVMCLWSFQAAFSCLVWAQKQFSWWFQSCCKLCRSKFGKGGNLWWDGVRSQGHREVSEAGVQRQLLQFLNRKLLVTLITLITRAGVLAVKEVLISELAPLMWLLILNS